MKNARPHKKSEPSAIDSLKFNAPSAPLAYVTARRVNGVWLWIMGVCPYCRQKHVHGGGDGATPALLGHRVSHCQTGSNAGYILVEAMKQPRIQTTEATAKWSNTRGGWILTVFECPFCDGTHRHKGGTDDNRPDWNRRYRAPCCREHYILNEVY